MKYFKKEYWIARLAIRELDKMDWFKQNKIKIGALLSSGVMLLKQANLSQSPGYNFALDFVLLVAGILTGTGTNVKSDKQEKVVADLKASGQFDRRG